MHAVAILVMLVNAEVLQDNVGSCEGIGCNLGAQKEKRCNDGLGRCNEQCDEDCCVKNCLGYHANGVGYCDDSLGRANALCQCSYPC